MPDVALLIDWENVYYTMRQHTEGPLPSTLSILQAILGKAAEFGPVRVKLAIFGQEVSAQDETLLMSLEFTGIEPIAVAQRMGGRLLKGRSDAVLITRAMKLLYKERSDIDTWFIVSGDRDLNALCKALKDEDKHVYLVAGDQSLANELRDSPYLRDDVFLLEDLIPQARWTRAGTGLRTDDTQAERAEREQRVAGREVPDGSRARRGRRGGRGRGKSMGVAAPTVPAVVPSAEPESEKEQRRLAVLLLDQLVALRAPAMKRAEFVSSIVPLSQKEASQVLEQRIDAGISQGHVRAKAVGRSRAKASMLLAPEMTSALVAETFFHLVRVLRRIETVTADARRVPAVEAVLDPLSRADQPGGIARGRTERRVVLETLFSIAEERGAIMTEQVGRDGKQITMCWLADGHPLVEYARRPAAGLVHLFNFVHATRPKDEEGGWVSAAIFAELLSRVEGDKLESELRGAVDRGLVQAQENGRRSGYVLDRTKDESRAILGEFGMLNGGAQPDASPIAAPAVVAETAVAAETAVRTEPAAEATDTAAVPRKRARRGTRGGRGRRGGRARKGTEAG